MTVNRIAASLKQTVQNLRSKCVFCGEPGNLFAYSDYHLDCLFDASHQHSESRPAMARKHKLSKPSDYTDALHKKYAGTPLELAGKELQARAYYPHRGWGSFAEDFEAALGQYLATGGSTDGSKQPSEGEPQS